MSRTGFAFFMPYPLDLKFGRGCNVRTIDVKQQIDRGDTWVALRQSGLLGRFVLLCFGVWLHSADTLVTATIAPAIVDDIGGIALINWTVTLYEVGAILAGAAAPLIFRRLGAKRTLTASALVYGVGCAMAGLAPSMALLLAGRLAQGAGGGILLALSYIAIQAWFEPRWWARLFGIVALIWGISSLLGPVIGGVFAAHAWRMAFGIFAAQACLLWMAAQAYLPAEELSVAAAAGGRWPVKTLLTLTTAIMVIALSGLATHVALSCLGVLCGALLLYLTARFDRSAVSRMFPSQLLNPRHPIGRGLLMVFALAASTTGFWAYGPLLLNILFGIRPLTTGYIMAAESIAWSVATLAVSRVPMSADRLLIRLGVGAICLGAGGFAAVVPAGSLPGIIACALLQGFGFGLAWPSIVHRLVRFCSEGEQAAAVASPETLQRIGYAVGAAAVGIAANLSGLAQGISIAAVQGAAFWVFAAFIPLLVLAMICAWGFTIR